jgi:hypothetical protein
MVFAHILGVPVEETALPFAPVLLLFIAGARAYVHQACRRLRAGQRRIRKGTSRPASESGAAIGPPRAGARNKQNLTAC